MDSGVREMSDAAASRFLLLHGARLWKPGRAGGGFEGRGKIQLTNVIQY